MKRTVGTTFVVAGATFFTVSILSREVRSGTGRATRPEPTPKVVAEGKTIYGDYCVTCHGDTGKGDGEAA